MSVEIPTRAEGVQRNPVVLFFYNLLYWPYLLSTVVVYFAPCIPLFLATFWWDKKLRVLHRYSCLWGGHYLAWAPLAGVTVEHRERGLQAQPCIYVSNHLSMVDVLAVFATRLPFLWVSKIENFYVPFLGWNMWLNRYIALKRGYLPSIMRMVRTCHRRLQQGYNLFIFPEGTRSPDGNLIQFHSGAFRLAVRFQVPIVPIIIDGTNHILPKSRLRICPQPVIVRVLEAIDPQEVGNDYRRLQEAVRSAMQREQQQIRALATRH